MPFTFSDLKSELRKVIFPAGEAVNLVIPHNQYFVAGIADLQQWVDCLQGDNTSLVNQCATFYNCGLTVFDAPRGIIREIAVIDKINPTTGKEDPTAADDWCSKIIYKEVDICHIKAFLSRAGRSRGCCNVPAFFGLSCAKGRFPVPTDEGLEGLVTLPLGYHYGQSSTDDPRGRATQGVWAKERGKIFIAPWLQSTETAVVTWDGIKRNWGDSDLIEDDPLFKLAIEEYVRWHHAAKHEHDDIEAARAEGAYKQSRSDLIHQCREETRARSCEPSHARGMGTSLTALYYNDQQQFTADCPDGTNGNSATATVPAGSVASNISVADANQKAIDEAQRQAESQLDCQTDALTFPNDAQSYTASCSGGAGAPTPDGNSVTVNVPAGTVNSTVSKEDANFQAMALAQEQAQAQLQCTYWNAEQSYTANCPDGQSGTPVTKTIAAHTYSSVLSQSDADSKAHNAAKTQAEGAIVCTGGGAGLFVNTQVMAQSQKYCPGRPSVGEGGVIINPCVVIVIVTVPAGTYSSLISVADANQQALTSAQGVAQLQANQLCALHQCGTFNFEL